MTPLGFRDPSYLRNKDYFGTVRDRADFKELAAEVERAHRAQDGGR